MPIARGGEANLYWHWRAHYAGHELAHGAVLSTSGRFCFNAGEIKRASEDFEKCKDLLFANPVKSKIAMHFSCTADLQMKHTPLAKNTDYVRTIADEYHKTLRHYNIDLIDTPHSLDGYEVVISPMLSCVDENGLKERMLRWVEDGGTWIVGPLSDVLTDAAAKYKHAPYGFLEDVAGIYTQFQMPIANDVFKAKWKDGSDLTISHTFDGYELRGAESLATYVNDHPNGLSVITSKTVGKGKIIVLGSLISGEDMLHLLEKELGFTPIAKASKNVELTQRGELILALEMQNEHGFVELNGKYQDVLTEKTHEGKVEILPHTVMVFKPIK
jgi:beta-galactosidase GanA